MGQPLPFAQGFYVSESLPISAQECINYYPNPPQTSTITEMALFNTPGLVEKTAAATGEFNRGSHKLADILYQVNGNNLYRIDRTVNAFGPDTFAAVAVNGAVSIPGEKRVQIIDNGVQMAIIVPEETQKFNVWIFTVAGGLVQLSDVDFNGPVSAGVYIDSFFLFTKKDGKQFFISASNDGFSYNALDFATAAVDPDPIKAPFVLRNQLFIFGSQTAESFQNIGGSGFPFQRIQGQVIQKGILAANTITEIQGSMVWLGSSVNEQPAIWISSGGDPERISTTAIENQLRTYTDTQIEDAFVNKYSQSGNYFLAFTFPGQTTFTYDFTSGLWHERKSVNDVTVIPWRVTTIEDAYGELFVGDSISNKIGIIDKDTFTDYGSITRRRFVTPPFSNNGEPFFVDSVELFMETGTALTTSQGSDPKMLMSASNDGGRTFNNNISRDIGLIGEYEQRLIWGQLGRTSREKMLAFETSEPIKSVIIKLEVNLDG